MKDELRKAQRPFYTRLKAKPQGRQDGDLSCLREEGDGDPGERKCTVCQQPRGGEETQPKAPEKAHLSAGQYPKEEEEKKKRKS